MQNNWNHNKQSLRPQCNQIRTQDLEVYSKLHNYMKTEQSAPEWLLDNEMKAVIKIFFKTNEDEDPTCQNL